MTEAYPLENVDPAKLCASPDHFILELIEHLTFGWNNYYRLEIVKTEGYKYILLPSIEVYERTMSNLCTVEVRCEYCICTVVVPSVCPTS